MSNYTSSFLPVISRELADRIGQSFSIRDLDEISKRMKDENPHLYTLIKGQFESLSTEEIFSSKKMLSLKTSFYMYGTMEEGARLLGKTASFEGFTSKGLPIVKKETIDELLTKEGQILGDMKNEMKMFSENPILDELIEQFSIKLGYINSQGKFQSISTYNEGLAMVYKLLDESGRRAFGIPTIGEGMTIN